MFIVGLTGGIGAGKSLVCKLFQQLNVPIIDADIIAKQVVAPGTLALEEIVNHFGNDILQNNALDRKKLRELVFNNKEERLWLEHLLHPLIENEMRRQLSFIQAPYCIVAIPLLFQVAPYEFIDRILVIDVDEETQIKRVMNRDQVSKDAVRLMIASQTSRMERLSHADDVILNDVDYLMLKEKVMALHHQYLKMSTM